MHGKGTKPHRDMAPRADRNVTVVIIVALCLGSLLIILNRTSASEAAGFIAPAFALFGGGIHSRQ